MTEDANKKDTSYYFERKAQFEREKAKAREWQRQKTAEMRAKYCPDACQTEVEG